MFDLKENESMCHVCIAYFPDDEGEYCKFESPNIGAEDGCFMFEGIPDPDKEKKDGIPPIMASDIHA